MASVEAMVIIDDGTVVPKNMVMRWIPVTERLPDNERWVLITDKEINYPVIAVYRKWKTGEYIWTDYQEEYNVLAWMDLPEIYEGDADSAMLDELSGEEERIAMEENPW